MIKTLPDCWWITPDITSVDDCENLISVLDHRMSQGIRHIQFRQTQLNPVAFAQVFHALDAYCQAHDSLMIINGTAQQAKALQAQGCYLNADVLMNTDKRPLSKDYWVGAYCHNLAELLHAQKINLDFVSLSPVKKTLSHPEQTPMGWDKFQDLVSQTTLPVYALGGLSLADKSPAMARGGQGIMGIRFDDNLV